MPEVSVNPAELTTALEAAKLLKIHFSTVYRWIKTGILHPVYIAGQGYLYKNEVQAIVKARAAHDK
jgi:excisionase family DNA binding protein